MPFEVLFALPHRRKDALNGIDRVHQDFSNASLNESADAFPASTAWPGSAGCCERAPSGGSQARANALRVVRLFLIHRPARDANRLPAPPHQIESKQEIE
jgi:hypothetical protein